MFAQKLEADPLKAQILLEVNTEGRGIDKALAILEESGITMASYKILTESAPDIILFLLSPEDMRHAVLKLIEAGFTKLKGFNPQPITK